MVYDQGTTDAVLCVTKNLSFHNAAGSVDDFKLFKINQNKHKYMSHILTAKGYWGIQDWQVMYWNKQDNYKLKIFENFVQRYRKRNKRMSLRLNLSVALINSAKISAIKKPAFSWIILRTK